MKALLKGLLHRFGLDLVRWPHPQLPPGILRSALAERGIAVVLDVGANEGQFAEELIGHGYRGTVVSFEPLPAAHRELTLRASRHQRWIVPEACAIGDAEGELVLNIAANSVSSSLLPMGAAHLAAAPASAYFETARVRVRRLDDALDGVIPGDAGPLLLKVDTQGYEDRVLAGAERTLERCQLVVLELSFAPLYDGQRLFPEMVARMESLGFVLRDLFPVFHAAADRRLMQVDGLFARRT
jgi:FkbM family methyltransferase